MKVTLRFPLDQYASAADENWASGSNVIVKTGKGRYASNNLSKEEF